MKKLISLALALVMILSLATVAFADTGDEEEPVQTPTPVQDAAITFNKQYKVNAGVAPAATFDFTVIGTGYKGFEDDEAKTLESYPSITASSVKFADKDSNSNDLSTFTTTGVGTSTLTLDVDNFNLGYYYYDIKETAGNLAGVTYASNTVKLVLMVVREDNAETKHYYAYLTDENRNKLGADDNAFVNEYNAGSLKVSKTITGTAANTSRTFTFTITFTAPTGTSWTRNVIPETTGDNGAWDTTDTLKYTVDLSNNEYVQFPNLPAGTTYTVTEAADGYTSDFNWSNKTDRKITANEKDTVAVENSLNSTPDTGVYLEAAPYILLLALAAAGMFILLTKKRSREY